MLGLGLSSSTSDSNLTAAEWMPYSLLFDGANDHVTLGGDGIVPANDTIKPITGGLTVAAWVKYDPETPEDAAKGPYGDSSTHHIVNLTKGGGYLLSFANLQFYTLVQCRDGDGNAAVMQLAVGYNKIITPTSGTDYARFLYKENGWHFVVLTWDGNKVIKLYVDGGTNQQGNSSGSSSTNFGSLVSTYTHGSDPSGNNPDGENKWYISWSETATSVANSWGQDHGGLVGSNFNLDGSSSGGNMWEGNIGDIGIWDKELTNSEIEALYNNHRPVDMSTTQAGNLQGYWRTKKGSGTVLEEMTGNVLNTGGTAIDATLVSVTGWSTDSPSNTQEPNVLLGEYV